MDIIMENYGMAKKTVNDCGFLVWQVAKMQKRGYINYFVILYGWRSNVPDGVEKEENTERRAFRQLAMGSGESCGDGVKASTEKRNF